VQLCNCSDVQTVQLVSRFSGFSGESYDFRRRGITCIFRHGNRTSNRTTSVQMLDIIVWLANISALIQWRMVDVYVCTLRNLSIKGKPFFRGYIIKKDLI